MGLFDKLKGAVGLGQPKLSVNLSSSSIKRGNSIAGTITIGEAKRELPIKEFVVQHIEIYHTEKWDKNRGEMVPSKEESVVNKLVIPMSGHTLKAGESLNKEFELEVSDQSKVSQKPYTHKLKVYADTPGLDPKKAQEIFIL